MNSANTLTEDSQRTVREEEWDVQVDGRQSLPLVVDGDYTVRYLGHAIVPIFNTIKVVLRFEVVEGPATGKLLIRPYRVKRLQGRSGKPRRMVLGRGSELLRDIVRLQDMKVRPDRASLTFLKRRLWKVTTRTVLFDYKQRPIPEALRYSVVDTIVGAETG